MRILFMRPGLVLPESYAGTQINLHWLCRKLVSNGHKVVLAATTQATAGKAVKVDHQFGYPVRCAAHVYISANTIADEFQPEVLVVTQAGRWMEVLPPAICHTPLVIYENEISDALEGMPVELKERAHYVANSGATSAHLLREYNIKSIVIPPIFGVGQFAGIKRRGDSVLFVSLQRRKGFDVAFEIAKSRPKAKFIFVESWTKGDSRTQMLRGLVGDMPNITLLANQAGLAKIMPQVKLLLMPSRGRESWGRTVTEAQICGIPALGSNRGHLPITIGPGGTTLDPDEPIERWLEAFDAIMNNPSVFEDMSRKALEHGSAIIEQIEPTYKAFENLLLSAIAGSRK